MSVVATLGLFNAGMPFTGNSSTEQNYLDSSGFVRGMMNLPFMFGEAGVSYQNGCLMLTLMEVRGR